MQLQVTNRGHAGRILDFDIENRPLSYWYDGNPTAEITAIAWSWLDDNQTFVAQLHLDDPDSAERMLLNFKRAYDQADMVTGHYIRRHDLPIINAGLMERRLPMLSEKLTSDTKMDLVKRADLSMSQESLEAMYDLPVQKYHMTQDDWREANRRTERGVILERQRVRSDVEGHKLLRAKLIAVGALKGPKDVEALMTHSEQAAEFTAAQTAFQKYLEELRVQTEHTIRARLNMQDHPEQSYIDAHAEAQKVLREMHERAESLRVTRDTSWRALKGPHHGRI